MGKAVEEVHKKFEQFFKPFMKWVNIFNILMIVAIVLATVIHFAGGGSEPTPNNSQQILEPASPSLEKQINDLVQDSIGRERSAIQSAETRQANLWTEVNLLLKEEKPPSKELLRKVAWLIASQPPNSYGYNNADPKHQKLAREMFDLANEIELQELKKKTEEAHKEK